jgi:predicted NBD/HSP70 family sugar kinase
MDVSDQLAYALNNLINIVDISTIILGHSAIYLPDYVLDSIEKRLNRISLFRYNRTIKIFKSRFEDNGPLLGSACNVLDQLFSGMLSQ